MAIYWKAYDQSHSFAFAGIVLMAESIASASTAGFRAMLIDRKGLKLPLLFFAPAYAVGIFSFNLIHNQTLIVIGAAIFGLASPPINLSARPLWREVVNKEWIRTAYALDVTFMSTTSILGPSIATFIAASKHPAYALNLTAALMLIGGLWMGNLKVAKNWKPVAKSSQKIKLFSLPEMQVLIAEGIIIGLGMGAEIIAIPSLATAQHVRNLSGVLLSIIGIANVVGSLIAGNISKHITPLSAFLRNYVLWSIAAIPICFVNFNLSIFIIGTILGLIGGAQMVFYLELSDAVRPLGVATALLGWLWTFEGSAQGVGQGIGGWMFQHLGIHTPFIFSAVTVFVGLNIIYFNRKYLHKANRPISQLQAEKAIYEDSMEGN